MRIKKHLAGIALSLVVLAGAACAPTGVTPTGSDRTATPGSTPTATAQGEVLGLNGFEAEGGNFAVLLSDEENAIGDFTHLWIDVSKVGVSVLDASGSDDEWLEIDVPAEHQQVDLTQFTGDDATALVQANLPPGDYGKIFVYIDDVEGELVSGETVAVKLPSSKLQLDQPFTVGGDEVTTFVFDITVIAAGNERSGVKYILKPVVDESGPDREYRVREREHRGKLDVATGDLDGDGHPDLVTITDENGSPVAGAKVEIEIELDDLTIDENGQVTFDVPAGTVELKIEAELENDEGEDAEGELRLIIGDQGVDEDEDEDEDEEADDDELTIEVVGEVAADAPLTVRVLKANGDPAHGVDVKVKMEIAGGVTGEDGTLSIDVPANGEVEIEARTQTARGGTEHGRGRDCDDDCDGRVRAESHGVDDDCDGVSDGDCDDDDRHEGSDRSGSRDEARQNNDSADSHDDDDDDDDHNGEGSGTQTNEASVTATPTAA